MPLMKLFRRMTQRTLSKFKKGIWIEKLAMIMNHWFQNYDYIKTDIGFLYINKTRGEGLCILTSITCCQQQISSNIQIQECKSKSILQKIVKKELSLKSNTLKTNNEHREWLSFFECNFITIKFSYASYIYSWTVFLYYYNCFYYSVITFKSAYFLKDFWPLLHFLEHYVFYSK